MSKTGRLWASNTRSVGDHYRAFGDKVIVAAGGIGSPMILRESGIRSVGYDFFFDPLIFVFGKIRNLKAAKGIPMSAGIHFAEDGIVMTDFNIAARFENRLRSRSVPLRQGTLLFQLRANHDQNPG